MGRTKPPARAGILSAGSLGAFVLDQLSPLGDVTARPMFGGAGFYRGADFFGLLYKERLYFRVSDATVDDYITRNMKPFAPFAHNGRPGAKGYYEVPLEILESSEDLVQWARAAQHVPQLTTARLKPVRGKR